ncbi:MAG TPA: flagellar protein FliS [Candidatus Binataceae bacterium]|nr:flagellar protein FliS [Candidatus Binataceae bacterium]
MRNATAYLNTQTTTLNHERAFEELYLRLARWTHEIAVADPAPAWEVTGAQLDRCIALLGYMSGVIDLSHSYEVAAAILSLHRFAIGALVQAKSERAAARLDGLPQLFVSLAGIFAAISERAAAAPRSLSA